MQAKRIAEKIVNCKGDNSFLSGEQGGISVKIRKDFDDTVSGNKRKDGQALACEEGIGIEKKKENNTRLASNDTVVLQPAIAPASDDQQKMESGIFNAI